MSTFTARAAQRDQRNAKGPTKARGGYYASVQASSIEPKQFVKSPEQNKIGSSESSSV